jgi:hypothetical protein
VENRLGERWLSFEHSDDEMSLVSEARNLACLELEKVLLHVIMIEEPIFSRLMENYYSCDIGREEELEKGRSEAQRGDTGKPGYDACNNRV